jgi:2-dehydro-3-deoxygluconokinase
MGIKQGNEEIFQLTSLALAAAKQPRLTTSCDLNYRSSLWPFEDARRKMTELMKYVDVCIGVEPLQSSEIDVEIVDRVCTGDAFSTGLICSFINQYEP